jgi:hypothetical protein
MYESGSRPQAVIMVPGTLELDTSGRPHAAQRTPAPLHGTPSRGLRKVA